MKRYWIAGAVAFASVAITCGLLALARSIFWTQIASGWAASIGALSASATALVISLASWRRDRLFYQSAQTNFEQWRQAAMREKEDAAELVSQDRDRLRQRTLQLTDQAYELAQKVLDQAEVGRMGRVMIQPLKANLHLAQEILHDAIGYPYISDVLLADAIKVQLALLTMRNDVDRYPDFAVPADLEVHFSAWSRDFRPVIEEARRRLAESTVS